MSSAALAIETQPHIPAPRPKSRWTPELTAIAAEMWNNGRSAVEIADALGNGITKDAVIGCAFRTRDLFKSKSGGREGKPVWTRKMLTDAARLWKSGHTAQEIADSFKISVHSVSNKISRNRDLFPRRDEEVAPVVIAKVYTDRVTRTVMGATVTLPRVTFIDGPYLEAAE